MTNKIKVLVVDDIDSIRNRHAEILNEDDGIEVCGLAQNGYEAVMLAGMKSPDVVLMDVEMENRTAGITATEQIMGLLPQTKVIMMTIIEEDEVIFDAFKVGACDYMLKNAKPAALVRGVKDAYLGQSPIRPMIASKVRKEFSRIKKEEESFLYTLYLIKTLTPTEQDILKLLYEGKSRKEICEERVIELSTVKIHIRNILKKLQKSSIQEVLSLLKDIKLFDLPHQ